MKKIFSSKTFIYSLFAAGGLFLGWILFHSRGTKTDYHSSTVQSSVTSTWTCAMHPQIRRSEPGNCPICGMELIPLNQDVSSADPVAIHLTKEAAALADVQTIPVSRQEPIMEVRLYGKIQADERLLQSQVAHFSGRVDKLFVNFTGESVYKGQILAQIYSPELIIAQEELLEALKVKESQPEIYQAAKERLRQWKLSEIQISAFEISGNVQNSFELVSNTSGIVTARRVNNGDYVSQGTVLYEIADLTRVWIMFDAYESDLPFISKGDKVTFTIQALPGKSFDAGILFIDPVIDPVTRVSKVRAEIDNQSGKLKPEMFANGIIRTNLAEYRNNLIIPRSSVLWTGKRSVVYVKLANSEEPVFKMREVELGPLLEESYVILSGLKEGEEIVSQGSFSIDAAAQLEGKTSMMNRESSELSPFSGKDVSQHSESVMNSFIKHASFRVSGNCEMCKDRIENAAKTVYGVTLAAWDLKTKSIDVDFNINETTIDSIQIVIAKAGHDTDNYMADDKTYISLPECCRYRK